VGGLEIPAMVIDVDLNGWAVMAIAMVWCNCLQVMDWDFGIVNWCYREGKDGR
jgi:hypothetical protein